MLNDAAVDLKKLSILSTDTNAMDFVNFLRIIRMRKRTIIAVVCMGMLLIVAYLCLATPKYQSNIQIVVEGKSGPRMILNERDNPTLEEDTKIDDAIELVQSRKLATRVIEQLGLAADPEFQPKAIPFVSWLLGILNYILPASPKLDVDPAAEQKIALDRLIHTFLDKIEVKRVERSNVLSISFSSQSPETAWKVATSLGENYLAWRAEQKSEGADKANAWLDERTRELAEKVRRAYKAAEEYRSSHGLLDGERVALVSEQISRVSANLIDASGERKKAEADLAQVKRLIATAGGDITSAQQILDSELYVRLRDQQLEIERSYAQQSRELGPQHPVILQLRAKRERARQDIREEVGKVARSLENKVAAAKQREASLAAGLAELKQDLAQANIHSVELRALTEEADASREMLRKMVEGAMEKDAERSPGAQSPQASVISEATFPETPATPKKALLLILAAAGSTLLGVLLALLVELMDRAYRSSEQIRDDLGIPVLAYVPKLARRRGGSDVSSRITAAPFSASATAIRAIRANLAASEPTVKTVTVVSSEPEEGKSTMAIAMASMEARAGRRILLLDADIRMSGIARALGLSVEQGLVNVLLDAVPIGEVVQRDAIPGVDVIAARETRLREKDAEAVTSQSALFGQAVNSLRLQYDVIIIDSPPASIVVDAQIVAALADVTMMVVAWGQTSRKSVQNAVHSLRAAGASVAGVIFNRVNDATLAHYAEGEAGYCNRRYHRYYTLTGWES